MSPAVAHAKAYPFPIPENSYLLDGPGYREFKPGDAFPDLTGLTPVLACGSNQSPEQLMRKFDNLELYPIPVLKTRLRDFDAVHSPHFSAYGSIPATLHYHPGVQVTLFTTWLHDCQIDTMHATEVASENYDYVCLKGLTIEMDGGAELSSLHAYISRRGALNHQGKPLALKTIEASARPWPQVSQGDVQAFARDRVAPGKALDAFITENVDNAETRRLRIEQLEVDALPFTYTQVRVVNV